MSYLKKLIEESNLEHEQMWAVAKKCPYRTVATKQVRDINNPLRVNVIGIRAYELELLEA